MVRKILLAAGLAAMLIGSSALSESLVEVKNATAKPVIKSAKLSTGVRLEYAEQGDPNGVPLVLLHGYGDSRRSYDLLLSHLPKSFHVYVLTQRGHGDSDQPASGYNARDYAADVAAFLDAVKSPKAVIVGHSLGSYIAQRFALDYPERVRGLVLIGSFVTVRGNPGVQELWDSTISKLPESADLTFIREFQQSTFHKPIPPEFFETVVRESAKVSGRVWRAVMAELLKTDFSDQLGRISAPTLILWGDKDSFFLRPEQEQLAKAIANSKLVVYEGIGHCPNWENPKRVAADLTTFVERLGR